MLVIRGGRQSGKSFELIKMSAETGTYILVSTRQRALQLTRQAKEMGLHIPFPVTLDELLACRFHGSSIIKQGLFIDDVDDVLGSILAPIEIKAVTYTDTPITEVKL